MRFIKLVVESFQGITRAELDFGPGLNILYGQNDLGKSTLACAVRAALLMQPKSTDAERFVSWYADAAPRVELTFADDDEHVWKVKKTFARGASAELLHSKDGLQFTLDCKAREVEQKLRGLLGWGIATPGGKGTPRGLPESFLANVLLAAQTDVDAILENSLKQDADDSGKVRLQKALATLAQDPLFKRVLDRAQQECDSYFTATGRQRRTQGSKLVAADDEVKRHRRERDELTQQLADSQDIEEQVRVCGDARAHCIGDLANAEAMLAHARAGLANARVRSAAETELLAARQALAQVDAQAARVEGLMREKQALAEQVAAHEGVLARANLACEHADAALRAAENAQRIATADDGEQKRLLREAELDASAAKLSAQRSQLEARRDLALRTQTTLTAAKQAGDAVESARATQAQSVHALAEARVALEQSESQLELARSLLAYGRWRMAAAAAKDAQEAEHKASESRAHAGAKEREAEALEERARLATTAVTARRSQLPTAEQLTMLELTGRSLEVAEAKLGGGLSVAIRPRAPIAMTAWVDQHPASTESKLALERVYEAERTLGLTVADLVEIEVTAGAADQRRAVMELQARWKHECVPLLTRAGAASMEDLAKMRAAVQDAEDAANQLLLQLAAMRDEARGLRERAALFDQQASRVTEDPSELAAKYAAIGTHSHDVLEASWTKLGKSWESQAQSTHDQRAKVLAGSAQRLAEVDRAGQVGAFALASAETQRQERAREAASALQSLDGEQPDALLRRLLAELTGVMEQHAEALAARAALGEEASAARNAAERALSAATAAGERARVELGEARAAFERASAALHTKNGECAAQHEQLERMNRAAALAAVQLHIAKVRELPALALAGEIEVQAAETALTRAEQAVVEANEAFHKAEGALTKVGGAQLRERVQQVDDALKAAQAREHDVTVDARAWQLLRDTLRAAENSEGAHLGRALAQSVSDKFAELTNGRYANLQFDPSLCAESVEAAGAAADSEVLVALSVGTRDQLATLVRLTIANQLKSAIILDDHLVHSDPLRLAWFREVLMKTAIETQVVAFTCRPEDYLSKDELPAAGPSRDLAGGSVRVIDLARVVQHPSKLGVVGAT
jgi:hypothetical protein